MDDVTKDGVGEELQESVRSEKKSAQSKKAKTYKVQFNNRTNVIGKSFAKGVYEVSKKELDLLAKTSVNFKVV